MVVIVSSCTPDGTYNLVSGLRARILRGIIRILPLLQSGKMGTYTTETVGDTVTLHHRITA